jgi:S-adenosylmethionine hydrolase
VGTARRLIYAEIGRQRYLTPDNGLVSLLATREHPKRIVALENSQFWLAQPSATFHGRDILAPVAAHLATGVDPGQLGPLQDNLLMLDWPQPQRIARGITGGCSASPLLYCPGNSSTRGQMAVFITKTFGLE